MIEALARRIAEAGERIGPHIRETPLFRSEALSDVSRADIWLKCENLQVTGSFKIRGATNRLLALSDDDRARGVVTASSGNHGAAVAWAGRSLGVPVTVFVPEGASAVKVTAMRRSGALVHAFGTDGLDTEVHARSRAVLEGRTYISPYNDDAVIAGQGTVGLDLLRQTDHLDAVFVAVGGGGLVGGIGAILKSRWPAVRVVGAQPRNSAVMSASIRAGRLLDLASMPTLSDGTAGGVEPGSITFGLCQAVVDDWVEVEEAEIAHEMRRFIEEEHLLVEGAAAVASAGLLQRRSSFRGQRVAVVLCGGNVSATRLKGVL